MSEWSSKLAERLKKAKSAREKDDSTFLERQRLIGAHGPALWEEVKVEVKTHCDDLNREMDERIAIIDPGSQPRWINVSGKTPSGIRQLAADFDPDRFLLHWRVEANSGKYEVAIGSNGKPAFYAQGDKGESLLVLPSTPKMIVEKMLEALFTGLFSGMNDY